jgi:uncharacterized protein DUF4844
MKIAIALVLLLVAFFVAGITGVLFYFWPTSFNNQPIDISAEKLDKLRALLKEQKFVQDLSIPYPGATNEMSRLAAQSAVDRLLNNVLVELPKSPQRAILLREFKRTLSSFDTPESEERDRLLVYLKQIMDILGVKSSAELLNVWRYGFPYGWLPNA